MRLAAQGAVADVLGNALHLLRERVTDRQLTAQGVVGMESLDHREELRRLAQVAAELERPRVGRFDVWGAEPLRTGQGQTERDPQLQLLTVALAPRWQGVEHRERGQVVID